jgi:adsorption protein B
MLLRDRKVILASALTVIGYLAAAMVLIDQGLSTSLPVSIWMEPLITAGSPLAWLLTINMALLGWRLIWRAIYTGRAHGWREGFRAVPRALVGNAINALAALRACRRYWRIAKGREANFWDKTAHHFPALAPSASV